MIVRFRLTRGSVAGVACALLIMPACGGGQPAQPPSASRAAPAGDATSAAFLGDGASATHDAQPTSVLDIGGPDVQQLNKPWTGDYGEIASGKRRYLRALVAMNKTMYFMDGPEQRGIAFESLREFEKVLGDAAGKNAVRPKVAIIPTTRDKMMGALEQGLGDIAIGGFTITEARKEQVDFSDPTITGITQVVVTGPESPSVSTLDDLSGQEVHVRRSSSYFEGLTALNKRFVSEGKKPIVIKPADELLEDEDLLEMVDAGIIPITIVKDLIAKFWVQIYDKLNVHNDITLATDGQLAWAIRQNTPELHKVVNNFVRTHKAGTMFGNTMLKRYMGSAARLKNPASKEEIEKFRKLGVLFRKYGGQYDLDWLLMAAQGYQESRLDQSLKSHVGAVGVMQVKPETAGDMGIRNIDSSAENNIHAGIKYMRFMVDRYYKDAPMTRLDKGLFALASYNAGPARVTRLRKKAEATGLDPNVWFRNVEVVAAREIGRETTDYVSNIFKYYTAYKVIALQNQRKRAAVPSPGA